MGQRKGGGTEEGWRDRDKENKRARDAGTEGWGNRDKEARGTRDSGMEIG
jgi:hypothetical protein